MRLAPFCLVPVFLLASTIAYAQGVLVPEPASRLSETVQACDSTDPFIGWNRTLGPFDCNGTVYDIVASHDISGDLYVGGDFTMIGGVEAHHIARWSPISKTWSALGAGLDGPAFALAFHGDTLYAGGRFQSAGGALAKNIARWNGTSWSPLGTDFVNGIDSTVLALTIIGDDLYAGGNFTYSDDAQLLNHIVRWNTADNTWNALDDGTNIGVDGGVAALAEVNDTLYVGGGFTKAGSSNAARIARWEGARWSNLISGVSPAGSIVTALEADNNNLYVGGTFTLAGGKQASHIARWSTLDRTWNTLGLGAGNGVDGPVYRMASVSSVLGIPWGVYVVGDFRTAGGDSANYIAVWSNGAGQWSTLDCGLDGPAFALNEFLIEDSGGVWVGGGFTRAGGRFSPNLAIYESRLTLSVDRREEADMVVRTTRGVGGVVELHITSGESRRGQRLALDLVDMQGRMVRALYDGTIAGTQLLIPVPSDVPSGRYLCRLSTTDGLASHPVVIVR